MDTLHTRNQMEMARNVHDVSSLNNLREAIAKGEDQSALQETAKQFEAIFVQMMLKSMRKAQEAMADEDSPFNSQQVKFYRDMHDQQLAVDLSSNGGLGLADLIVKQLGQNNPDYTSASVIRGDGNLSSINRQAVNDVQTAQDAVLPNSPAPVGPAYKAPIAADQNAFIEALYPHAQKAAEQLGGDPKAIIAQAAVETGWGQYVIHDGSGTPSYNLFGIKADKGWQGKQAVVDTLEFDKGMPSKQKAAFRSYDSIDEAMQDYVRFLQSSPRYEKAVSESQDSQAYFNALQQAGYATDPAYADKLMSVYRGNTLNGFQP
ncbi:flagellar assembly peptidoglycan hydrolase FlgJ [Salinimonas sp. HHU 13199]|uniref:Peptidoglycan hydrolase FlgJ n=1 Tax=Salinimonas profundi TaxID=2729140 RepID=A0ABR8LLW7_9ALTE|nr:flagellar assembly peptidoglycan hydrolase FlgJ [Salinimonas profundi]MBD3585357.1 flagellar assembly peptidoglycan hydrolase FlgJ [Salinimonas profundi]